MCEKFQSFIRPGICQILEIPPNAIADKWGVFKVGDFKPQDSIQGEITIVGGHLPIEFTGIVSTVNNDGRIETFHTTFPKHIIPELSEEVSLINFDLYRITSVD